MSELHSKYEKVLEAYNKEVQKRIEFETKVLGQSTRPRITYPRPPMKPFKSTPLIEMLDTPQRPQYYTAKYFEEEKSKLWALHVELNVQYEDKLRKALMYLVDKIEWPLFYDQLAKVINIWDGIKASDEALKPIVNKWSKRRKEITFLCYSIIRSSHDHIEITYNLAHDLPKFDDKRVELQRRILSYLDKYKSKKFDLFPLALDKKNKLKNRDEWAKELDDLFCLRMNEVINEKRHAWWAATIEEIVNAQLFFDSLKQNFVSIDKEAKYVIKKQSDILQFNWPDDTLFDKWMANVTSDEQLEKVESDDDEMNLDEVQIIDRPSKDQRREEDKTGQSSHVESTLGEMDDVAKMKPNITITLVVHDDASGNSRLEVNLQESQPGTSFANLIATYAEDSE